MGYTGISLPRGKTISEETRAKISTSNKGRVDSEETKEKKRISALGNYPTIETRAKMSKSGKGRIVAKETRNKISKSLTGQKKSNTHIENMRLCRIGKPTKRCKPVLQYDKEGNFIKEWNKIKEASIFLNKPKDTSSITQCCRGKIKFAFGFIWKYKEDS